MVPVTSVDSKKLFEYHETSNIDTDAYTLFQENYTEIYIIINRY